MKLYVKKIAQEWVGVFDVGAEINVSESIGIELVSQGLATATKPKPKAKKSNDKDKPATKSSGAANVK